MDQSDDRNTGSGSGWRAVVTRSGGYLALARISGISMTFRLFSGWLVMTHLPRRHH
jgi:hypothetical protein